MRYKNQHYIFGNSNSKGFLLKQYVFNTGSIGNPDNIQIICELIPCFS